MGWISNEKQSAFEVQGGLGCALMSQAFSFFIQDLVLVISKFINKYTGRLVWVVDLELIGLRLRVKARRIYISHDRSRSRINHIFIQGLIEIRGIPKLQWCPCVVSMKFRHPTRRRHIALWIPEASLYRTVYYVLTFNSDLLHNVET